MGCPTGQPLFLNVDDDLGLAEFFLEALVLAAQLLVLNRERLSFRMGAARLRKRLCSGLVAFLAPAGQSRGVNPLAPQDRAGPTRRGGVDLGQDALLILGCKHPAPGTRRDFRVQLHNWNLSVLHG